VTVRPLAAVVHWAASGQVAQAAPNAAVRFPSRSGVPIGVVTPFGSGIK
jgi:hypothetical protein